MADIPDRLELSVGEERTITLPGLGTAGYIWQERVSGAAGVVAISWRRGFAPGAEPAAVGASAPETATIRATGQGEATVQLVQVRPWQADAAPNQEHRLTVRVR